MLKDFGMNILVILWLLFCGVIDYPKKFSVYWFIAFGRESYCLYCFSYVGQKESPTKLCISHFISELSPDF